jgi:hypothetical protein
MNERGTGKNRRRVNSEKQTKIKKLRLQKRTKKRGKTIKNES